MLSYSWEENVKKEGPLARRMTPLSLDEFVGQEHLVGQGKPLRKMVEEDALASMVFYGPPGTGKTALARIIASRTKARFVRLNAVAATVKDVRGVLDEAKTTRVSVGQRTILFIDEIHRFNKAQQDVLLPAVEEGLVYFIGATTENPFFSVISPLLSRCHLFTFESLSSTDVKTIVHRALEDQEKGLGTYQVSISLGGLDYLAAISGGDARIALNVLELAVLNSLNQNREFPDEQLTGEQVQNVLYKKNLRYDQEGDYHYDIISAFIKSIRGSDPDAAVYWLARMLEAGEDPLFIARRLVISASEDIGNADPAALPLAVAAAQAVHQIGLPEGRIALAQAATYLASAPKSNKAYLAINQAQSEVRHSQEQRVPAHLRDASYKGAKQLGHGKGYLYPHDYPGHYVPQSYLPQEMEEKLFYQPSEEGQEKEIKKRLQHWRALKHKKG